jgi:hypothetical protein
MKNKNIYLITAGSLNFIAAALHIAIIVGGAEWYRFFGAGEELAVMAEAGMRYPAVVTTAIAGVLTLMGIYAWSGAGLLRSMPLLKTGLIVITGIFCLRGAVGFLVPFIVHSPYVENLGMTFWLVTSSICLGIGILYALGLVRYYSLRNHLQ